MFELEFANDPDHLQAGYELNLTDLYQQIVAPFVIFKGPLTNYVYRQGGRGYSNVRKRLQGTLEQFYIVNLSAKR